MGHRRKRFPDRLGRCFARVLLLLGLVGSACSRQTPEQEGAVASLNDAADELRSLPALPGFSNFNIRVAGTCIDGFPGDSDGLNGEANGSTAADIMAASSAIDGELADRGWRGGTSVSWPNPKQASPVYQKIFRGHTVSLVVHFTQDDLGTMGTALPGLYLTGHADVDFC